MEAGNDSLTVWTPADRPRRRIIETVDLPKASDSADVRKLRGDLRAHSYSWGDEYRGDRAQLIRAGLAEDGLFPGDNGRGKVQVSYNSTTCPPRMTIHRYGRLKFTVSVYATQTERARRDALEDFARAQEEEKKNIGWLPDSKADFRECMLSHIRGSMLAHRAVLEAYGKRGTTSIEMPCSNCTKLSTRPSMTLRPWPPYDSMRAHARHSLPPRRQRRHGPIPTFGRCCRRS